MTFEGAFVEQTLILSSQRISQSQHIPSSSQNISMAVTIDDDDDDNNIMMTPPRVNRLCGNFSPISAVCTPVPMAKPCPSISSPSIGAFILGAESGKQQAEIPSRNIYILVYKVCA